MTWKRDTFKTVFVQSAGWLGILLKHGGGQRVEVKKRWKPWVLGGTQMLDPYILVYLPTFIPR